MKNLNEQHRTWMEVTGSAVNRVHRTSGVKTAGANEHKNREVRDEKSRSTDSTK